MYLLCTSSYKSAPLSLRAVFPTVFGKSVVDRVGVIILEPLEASLLPFWESSKLDGRDGSANRTSSILIDRCKYIKQRKIKNVVDLWLIRWII